MRGAAEAQRLNEYGKEFKVERKGISMVNKVGSFLKITVKNDPLLTEKKFERVVNNRNINIYRILSKYRKGAGSLVTYYHLDRSCRRLILRLLKKKYKTINRAAEMLLKGLELYRNKQYRSKIKEKWRIKQNLNKGNNTIEYARVLSLLLGKNIEDARRIFSMLISHSKYFIAGSRKIRWPGKIKELDNELAYLVGVLCGDGHIEKNLVEIKIVDGHPNKALRKDACGFLCNVNEIIKKKFNCSRLIEKTSGNYTIFRYNCSVFCRIMNYIYEIPAGDKSRKISVPAILKNTSKERFFWRGMFDTDGSIRPKNKEITFSTVSEQLYRDLLDFCKRNNIAVFTKKEDETYRVVVIEESVLNFARIIGSGHPRKQRNLMGYLRKGASYKKPTSKKPNKKLEKIIRYLRPYRENVYIRLTARREMVAKKDIQKRLSILRNLLNVRIVEVKRPRKNNHYYICSRRLVREINNHYAFKPVWDQLPWEGIIELKKGWDNYD